MSAQARLNLALAAVAIFYAAQVVFDLTQRNFCSHLAIDYCSFWSAGQVARTHGYAAVYDLDVLEATQRLAFPRRYDVDGTFATVPTPYLPIFIAPFALLSPLGPIAGYWVWTVANLALLVWYLRFFSRRTTGSSPERQLLHLLLVSFPLFLNFFYGQVNALLAIVVGEYMRKSRDERHFSAGAWLAGLLIKPQYLILIGIALLLQRSWRTLAGLAAVTLAVIGGSYALMAPGSFEDIQHLWLRYATGLPTTGPSVMMNWRMVGIFVSSLTQSALVWPLAYFAMAASALGGLWPWVRPLRAGSLHFSVASLGVLAATAAVAWHSHISSATMLICPLMLLCCHDQLLPRRAMISWALIPALLHFVVLVLAGVTRPQVWSGGVADFLNFLSAVAPFSFNVYFVVWALRRLGHLSPASARVAA